MSSRKRNSPGIEINEIDRSAYDETTDNSIVGTSTLVIGFADKGEDYHTKWINSLNTFIQTYGYPYNEAERYFFNAANEVLSKGGVLYTAKLPYDNEQRDSFTYVDYSFNGELTSETSGDEDLDPILEDIQGIDSSITSYVEIDGKPSKSGRIGMEEYDNFMTGHRKPRLNSFRIVDKTRAKYIKDDRGREYIGLLPVIVSPVNALYYQNIINSEDADYDNYNIVHSITNLDFESLDDETSPSIGEDGINNESNDENPNKYLLFSRNIGGEDSNGEEGRTYQDYTLSRDASQFFPKFTITRGAIDPEYLKCIGVVVFRMTSNPSNYGKIEFTPVESFVGSFDRRAVNEQTKQNMFIDDIINMNSSFINFFSNIDFSRYNDRKTDFDKASTILIRNQVATSLGFYHQYCDKTISVKNSILDPLTRIFDANQDVNTSDIDLVLDGGVSNIAQFIHNKGRKSESLNPDYERDYYDPNDDESDFILNDSRDITTWSRVLQKYDDFCKFTRRDCMFIADGLRSLCLEGNQKIVRRSKPENSVYRNILPKLRLMSGYINSSYGAGYINWFMCKDKCSGDYIWLPPSIKVGGVYLYTDTYHNYWDAPAGLNRGKCDNTYDVAFNPTNEETGEIYNLCWNYALSYPFDGIVVEGQKTFQTKKTAFDRVNVRRLFLGLEQQVRSLSRYLVYEQITDYMLQGFRDQLSRIMDYGVNHGGIKEYYIVCDGRNNNAHTIDNNEVHVLVAVKPVKCLEFLVLDFVCTSQSMNVQEVAESEL